MDGIANLATFMAAITLGLTAGALLQGFFGPLEVAAGVLALIAAGLHLGPRASGNRRIRVCFDSLICGIMADSIARTATATDAERCWGALALAFSADPPSRWIWPDPLQYLEAFPRFAKAFGGCAIQRGTAHYYEGFSGVALWLPPGTGPDEEALMQGIEDTVVGERKAAMFSMFEQMDALHPREAHWHLPLIGVDPAHQGKGIGAALLTHVLKECDRERVPAYLEATSARSVSLYQRHGFEPAGLVQVADAPPIVPMLRRPR